MRSLQVRFFHALYLLLFAAFALNAPIASANTGTITIECTKVTFTFFGFPNKPGNTVSETVIVGGVTKTQSFTFNGSGGTNTVPISVPTTGTTLVRVRSSWTTNGVTGSIGKSQYVSGSSCVPACVPGTPNPAGAHATGEAYDLALNLLGITLAPTPFVSSSQTGVGVSHQDRTGININIPSTASVAILPVETTGRVGSDTNQAVDSSSAAVGGVNLFGGRIVAGAVRASAEAIARGDGSAINSAGSTFQNLIIDGVQYDDVAPNTKVAMPALGPNAYVVLYERIGSTTTPAAGVLSGGTYGADLTVNMIHVVIPSLIPGLPANEVIVSHAKAHADFPQTAVCTASKGNTVSGHAFVIGSNLGDFLPITVGLSEIPSTGGTATQTLASGMLPAPIGGGGASSSSSTGTVGATSSTATSKAEVGSLSLFSGMITGTAIKAQSNSTATALARSSDATGTTFLDLTLAGNPIGNTPAPNTKYEIPGLGYAVINEQIPDGPAAGHTGLTVRGMRLHSDGIPGVIPGTDIIVSEAHSDATFK